MPALVTSRYVNAYGKSQPTTQVELESVGSTDTFIVRYNTSGKALWSARISSPGGTTTSYNVNTDSKNNLYVVGQGGAGVRIVAYNADGTAFENVLATSSGTSNNDGFIIKYHTSGYVLWTTRVASTGADITYDVSVDSDGNVYGVGFAAGTLTAYNADGSAFGTTIAAAGAGDAFIVKYNSSGTVQWLARIASTAADTAYAVRVGSSGNIYVAGQCGTTSVTTTAYNSDGSAYATTISSAGGSDAFIVKYNTNGVVQWVARIATTTADFVQSIDIDLSENLYLWGREAGSGGNTIAYDSDVIGGAAFATQPAPLGSRDSFLVKYDSTGAVQWVVLIAGANTEDAYRVRVDKSNSANIYTTHNRGGSGNGDTYLRKHLASTGATVWEARVDSDSGDTLWGLTTDIYGDIYVGFVGGQLSSIRVRNTAGTAVFTIPILGGNADVLLIKYNTSGTPLWVRRLTSMSTETSFGLTSGSSDDIYIIGQFSSGSFNLYGQTLSLFSTMANSGGTDAFIVNYNSNGAPQWVGRIASTGDDIAYGTTTDSQGNIYVVGKSGASALLTAYNADGSSPAINQIFTSDDVFIVKYNAYGTVQWITYISSSGTDIGYAVATDPSGNLYITGAGGSATVTAYSVGGIAFSPSLSNAGSGDAFLVKYNSFGVVQWNARISSTQQDIGYGVATDSSGNVYVTGSGGTGVSVSIRNSDDTVFGTLADLGGTNVYVAKYNTSGTVQWIARIGSSGNDSGNSIAVDSSGNVYIAVSGASATVTAYEGGNGTGASFGSATNVGGGDIVIVKYNTSGVGQWVAKIGSTATDLAYGITSDSLGNIYIVGQSSITATTTITTTITNADGSTFPFTIGNAGAGEALIVKYDTNGNAKWGTRISSTIGDILYGVACDRTGNVYVVGQSGSGLAGDTSVFNSNGVLFSSFRESCCIVKFDTNGYVKWILPLRGNSTTSPSSAITRSIACDYFGNISVVGSSVSGQSMYIYGSDLNVYKLLYVPRGSTGGASTDAFIIKYSPRGIPQWASIFGTSTGTDILYSVTTDSDRNIYSTGQYGAGTMTLVNGDGSRFTPTLAITGTLDSVIVKHNTNGIIQWRARITGGGSEQSLGIIAESGPNGSVYAVGQGGSGTATTFINANDTTTLAVLSTTAGIQDGFVVKYNSSGTGVWRARISSTTVDSARGIGIDSSNNIYFTGQAGAAGFYNASDTLAASVTDTGSGDSYVAKYDSSGNFQWVAKIASASTNADIGRRIAVYSSGNSYAVGRWGGSTLTITDSDGVARLPTMTSLSATDLDAYIVKFNQNGLAQWRTRIASAGTNSDDAASVIVDSNENVYVSGTFFGNGGCVFYQGDGTTAFATISSLGNLGGYVVKYDPVTGNPQWIGQIDSIADTADNAQSLAVDSEGNVYVSINSGTGVTIVAYNGDRSLFGSTMTGPTSAANVALVKYNSSGQVQWLTSFGTDGANSMLGLTVDSSGNIIASGSFAAAAFLPESNTT